MNDDPTTNDAARRLREAVSAHGEQVRPDEVAALGVIRERAASAKRRRLVGATALGAAAALVVGVAIGVSLSGDGDQQIVAADGGPDPTTTVTTFPCPEATTTLPPGSTTFPASTPSTTVTTTGSIPTTSAPRTAEPSTTTTTVVAGPETTIPLVEDEESVSGVVPCDAPTTVPPSTTPTTVPAEPVAVVFPTNGLVPPDQPWPWPDPESTARGFLELIGVTDPALGTFEATGPGEGQIALYLRAEDGTVRTTVERSVLRMALVDGHWAVLDAASPSISLELVAVGGESLTVSGRGRGFEGTLHVRLIGHGDVDFRREAVVTASGGEELLPFSTTLDLSGSSGQRATVIVTNDSGLDGGPVDVSARAIQLP